jgi:hypothetical protein
MDNFFGDPYQNINTIEYKLSIPPSKVMEIVKEQTENLTAVQRYLPFPTKDNVQFWSRFSGDDIFKILRKSHAKGYSNSFAPWLVGWVKPDQKGCSVRLFFAMDEKVSKLNQTNFYMLVFFTVITSLILISNIYSGKLTSEAIFGVILIVIFWIFLYGLRKIGFQLGQQDRTAMIEFVENLFAKYRIS